MNDEVDDDLRVMALENIEEGFLQLADLGDSKDEIRKQVENILKQI